MPITQNFNIEWLNHNSQRRYPLAVDALATDTTGDFELPNDFLVAMYLSVPASINVQPASFSLMSVKAFSTGYIVTIGYWNGATMLPVASGAVLKANHTKYQSYVLRGIGNFYDVSGHITIGPLDNIDAQPPGDWTFALDGGRLDTDCVRPQLRGVAQLRVQNGTSLSLPITGDVILQAGTNMQITVSTPPGEDPTIVFSAIAGAGLNEDCVCEGDPAATPIKTINNVGPDADGNFTLLGISCIQISPINGGLQLDDTCADPCCGCTELTPIVEKLQTQQQVANTLESFVQRLQNTVEQFEAIVLGSRLGDQGCS